MSTTTRTSTTMSDWPWESIGKWDGRITETLHEEWIEDDDGPKNINRLFYKYFTNPQGNPEHSEWQAVADEVLIGVFGWGFESICDKAFTEDDDDE